MARRKQNPDVSVRVLRLRLKDKHVRELLPMARAVNTVWNFCNELSAKILEREGRWASSAELQKYLNGASKEGLEVGSSVFQQVADEFVAKRVVAKKRQLRWRVSNPERANYSLGWIPFKNRALVYIAGQVQFQGLHLSLWDSYGLSKYDLSKSSGNICEDARGRWYLNICVEVPKPARKPEAEDAVGIDLGLKELLATSDGWTIEAQRFYRELEPALAIAQRNGNKRRVRAIHAKIANRRKNHLHQVSHALVRKHGAIFVGDANALALAKTNMAKSVLDAGWSSFRTMLKYKCDDAGVWFAEINEAYSTKSCSACGAHTGPSGQDGLNVREWTCSDCGTSHHRDVNAAANIKAAGLAWLEGQFAIAKARSDATAVAVNEAGAKEPAGAGLVLL